MANRMNEGMLQKRERLSRTAELHKGGFMKLKQSYESNKFNVSMVEKELSILKDMSVEAFKPSNPEKGYEVMDDYVAFLKELKIGALELSISQMRERLVREDQGVKLEQAKISLLEQGVDVDNLSDNQILSK